MLSPVDPERVAGTLRPHAVAGRPLTVCRFDGETGDYVLGIGQGLTVEGPVTNETYVWMEVDDWPRRERRIMRGPYIHHCSAIHDLCADALVEVGEYIPGLRIQRFDGES